MEVKNIHPAYASDRERQERLEEAYRQCAAALAALEREEKEREA